ncbi:hypothetical protein PX554_06160 [Sphingomonas sp. H39-1-10]|nr:hypothetical protein [Sphingomonas pollutisoli]MDF0487706.1 hypothetical protein [Sphingomonas pollutisoli]
MSIGDEFDESDPVINVRIVDLVQVLQIPDDAGALVAPRHHDPVVILSRDTSLELVEIDYVETLLQLSGFGEEARPCLFMLPALVGMTFLERGPDEVEHRFVKADALEQLLEVLVHHFLSNIRLGAFPLISGAVVVDVFLLLDLRDDRTAAMTALHHAGVGEVFRVRPYVRSRTAINDCLNGFPKLMRNDRLVPPLKNLAVPIVGSAIQPVSQDIEERACPDRFATATINETEVTSYFRELVHREIARRGIFEQALHTRGNLRVDDDHLLAEIIPRVAIAERSQGRPVTLGGLLVHAFARLLGQIVDVVLGHQHLDGMHELLGGTRLARDDLTFFREMDHYVEFIERNVILEIAI